MLIVKDLVCQFEGGKTIEYPDWQVEKDGRALILGASGSGKTTLLHLLSGLKKPGSGSVSINDTYLNRLSTTRLDQFRGQNIGLVFQKPHLIAALTVEENIHLAGYLGGKKLSNERVSQLLESLQVSELAQRKIHQISQGQAQRVAISRAVANDPKVIFADEPTASLDDDSCHSVISLLNQQAKENGAMLIVATHDQRVKSEFSNHLKL